LHFLGGTRLRIKENLLQRLFAQIVSARAVVIWEGAGESDSDPEDPDSGSSEPTVIRGTGARDQRKVLVKMRGASFSLALVFCCGALAQNTLEKAARDHRPFARTELYDEQLLMQQLQIDQQQVQAQLQVILCEIHFLKNIRTN